MNPGLEASPAPADPAQAPSDAPVLASDRRNSSRSNRDPRALLDEVFEPVDRAWRGVGVLPRSGLALRGAYRGFAAEERFPIAELRAREHPECIAGHVLRGAKRPTDCPLFGGECTPTRPRGAPMVSSEGACAAYYRYRRRADGEGA